MGWSPRAGHRTLRVTHDQLTTAPHEAAATLEAVLTTDRPAA
jgi:hypothetical protein